ncbi:MAG TPA: hypothetical protein PKK12_07540 [Candidatus Aminicenantes bacterium]|nr:hypothetical protein [Candidatus Aminicenantes bacterium]
MQTDYAKKTVEDRLVRQFSHPTMIFSLATLASVVIYAAAAYFLSGHRPLTQAVKDAWGILNIVSIMVIIVVLAIRKTIYFSSRLIREPFTLPELLKRWRVIDIVLISLAELVALLGLVITVLGMPFANTFHYFVSSFLLIMILMPIAWKVHDKLRNFKRNAGTWND